MYLAFFKTVLAALFRTFGLLLRFLPLKASFLHDHLITQHSDFSSILAVSSTDKPINRSIHAYAFTWRNVFALRGFIFRDIHKKQRRSSSNSGYKIRKKMWLENILSHGCGSTQIEYLNQKIPQQG